MRGLITMHSGYIWNGWANDKTKFSNESMSGRTFAAMVEAAKSDTGIAERVRHYLYRCPEEFYHYETDPDALDNQIDHPEVELQLSEARSSLLGHMQRTEDPQLENYTEYLGAIQSK